VVLTGLLLIACQDLLFVYGLPLIALPYIVVTLIFLLALRTRLSVAPPWLVAQPGMPEQNYERARLARVRNGDVNSVPLLLPVFGRWQVYQGFDGEHTHRAPWHMHRQRHDGLTLGDNRLPERQQDHSRGVGQQSLGEYPIALSQHQGGVRHPWRRFDQQAKLFGDPSAIDRNREQGLVHGAIQGQAIAVPQLGEGGCSAHRVAAGSTDQRCTRRVPIRAVEE
jgi:hypothetical protein